MTFQTFRFSGSKADWLALPSVCSISVLRVLIIAFFLMAAVGIRAQESSRMEALIGQSLSKVQQPTPEALLNCIAELKRIDAMFPDSVQPKYQMALQSLNFSPSIRWPCKVLTSL